MQVVRSSLVVMAILGAALPAFAQSRTGGTNSSGMFGSRNLGGGTSFGNMGGGTGAGGAAANSAAGAALTGNERFLAENRRGAFVGADSGDTANARGAQTNMRGMTGMQGMFGNQGIFSQMNRMQQFQGNQNQGRNNKQLRIRLTMGGATPAVRTAPPARITNGFQVRLRRLPALQLVTPIEAVADGPVLVLRGEVASEGDRQMVEDLAMLEPEVTQVRNEIVVREAAPPAEALPAPMSAIRSSAP
jgi:osmotically-inducible protein OsmY